MRGQLLLRKSFLFLLVFAVIDDIDLDIELSLESLEAGPMRANNPTNELFVDLKFRKLCMLVKSRTLSW